MGNEGLNPYTDEFRALPVEERLRRFHEDAKRIRQDNFERDRSEVPIIAARVAIQESQLDIGQEA